MGKPHTFTKNKGKPVRSCCSQLKTAELENKELLRENAILKRELKSLSAEIKQRDIDDLEALENEFND